MGKKKSQSDSAGPGLNPDLGPALAREAHEPPPAPGTGKTPPAFRLAGATSLSEDYGTGLKLSVAFHAALAIFIVLKTLVFPGTMQPFVPTLRVDLVGLPDALKKDLRAPNPAADPIAQAIKQAEEQAKKIKDAEPVKEPVAKSPPAKEAAAPDEMALKPKKVAQDNSAVSREKRIKNALDRIKALNKIGAEEDASPAKPVAAPLLKGNRVSHGSSVSGDAKEGEATYPELIREKLHENWALPVVLIRQNLSAQVRIFIDAYGRVTKFAFTRSSGNPKFDDEVKKAILQSQPFPRPPADLVSTLLNGGIEFGFPL